MHFHNQLFIQVSFINFYQYQVIRPDMGLHIACHSLPLTEKLKGTHFETNDVQYMNYKTRELTDKIENLA